MSACRLEPPGVPGIAVLSIAVISAVMIAAQSLLSPLPAHAQNRGAPPAAAPPPPTARASAPIDLTGYWVAFVNEDWRYRMITPAKGDYRGVPITREALNVVNAWDPAADEAAGNQCKSYGAAAIMRVPGRLHVTWQDDNTLKLETDAGMQTRLFKFAPSSPAPIGKPTWQGNSAARWERAPGAAARAGSLTVVTTNMRAGYLRKNGVPYSENATVTEYFDAAPQPGGGQLLVVTTVVDDPRYLLQPFIVSSHFKKEADASKWDPTPCSATW
ncbi:MAG: hypothetical protein ABJA98_34605 [Acidobacteriota bacterium]